MSTHYRDTDPAAFARALVETGGHLNLFAPDGEVDEASFLAFLSRVGTRSFQAWLEQHRGTVIAVVREHNADLRRAQHHAELTYEAAS